MDFNGIPLVGAMKAKLSYLSERQSVLAQNIANADTPDYRARDIEAPNFKRMVGTASQKLPMAITDKQHVSSSGTSMALMPVKRKSTYEQSPVGNNVTVEEEMMYVAENQAEYQKMLSLYRKTIAMFKTALGAGQNG